MAPQTTGLGEINNLWYLFRCKAGQKDLKMGQVFRTTYGDETTHSVILQCKYVDF